MAYKKNYNKQEYKEKKEEEIKAIVGSIEDGIKQFQNSDFFKNYLEVMSKFHKYSFSNSLLIAMQKPHATLVAGFNTWKNQGRTVNKGEKAITILAPCIYKQKEKVEVLNPETNKKETREVEHIKRIGFKKVSVFDISQTQGKEIPRLTHELKGDVKELDIIKEAVEEITGIKIEYEAIRGGAKGYFSPVDNRIAIKEGMEGLQQAKTILHEGVHAVLHCNLKKDGIDRHRAETEAEATAFTICSRLGLDTSQYSFPYLASWASNPELTELKASLKTIQETAMKFIDKIEDKLKVLEVDKEIEDYKKETIKDKAKMKEIEITYSNYPHIFKGDVFSLEKADKEFREINEEEKNHRWSREIDYEVTFKVRDENGNEKEVIKPFEFGFEKGGLKEFFENNFSKEVVTEIFGTNENKNESLKDKINNLKDENKINEKVKKEVEMSL